MEKSRTRRGEPAALRGLHQPGHAPDTPARHLLPHAAATRLPCDPPGDQVGPSEPAPAERPSRAGGAPPPRVPTGRAGAARPAMTRPAISTDRPGEADRPVSVEPRSRQKRPGGDAAAETVRQRCGTAPRTMQAEPRLPQLRGVDGRADSVRWAAVTCAGAHDPKLQYRVVRILGCPACVGRGDTSPADDPIRKRHQDL